MAEIFTGRTSSCHPTKTIKGTERLAIKCKLALWDLGICSASTMDLGISYSVVLQTEIVWLYKVLFNPGCH